MKQLIEFPLEDGRSIVMEVDETHSGVIQASRGPGEIVGKATQTFEAAMDRIKPTARTIISKLRELKDSPDEVSIEFGLTFSVQAGVIITGIESEATLKVSLTWKKEE